jgi:hypothetical protein
MQEQSFSLISSLDAKQCFKVPAARQQQGGCTAYTYHEWNDESADVLKFDRVAASCDQINSRQMSDE